jgi:hypothetical protein
MKFRIQTFQVFHTKMKIRTDTIVNVQYQTAAAAVKNLNNLKDIK